MNSNSIQTRLREFLVEMTGLTTLSADTDLLSGGVIDSLMMMDLILFIETEYGVRIEFTDIQPDTFRDVRTVAALVASRMPGSQRAAA